MTAKGGGADKKEEGVKVFLRIRPFSKKELLESEARGNDAPVCVVDPVDDQKVEFLDPQNDFMVKECMTFDKIFWSIPESQYPGKNIEFADQELVYTTTGQQCLLHAFEGYNSCMLAYGQTGSGKTHSMMGSVDDEGVIPRLCKELFQMVEEKKADTNNKKTYKVMLSFLEIYNEKVKDLLAAKAPEEEEEITRGSGKAEKAYKDLKIRQHPTRGPFVEGLREDEVTNWAECSQKIAHGFAARTTKATAMNAVSSRSHAMFKLELTQSMKASGRGPTKQVHTVSSINLVDLAGSERANRTGAKGDTMAEGIAINQSLTVLRKVIDALMENGQKLKESKEKGTPYQPKAPPYRESTLTWLLSESFGGNSKTMMIAAASPHESNAEETLQTLKYALKTREIVNTVQRNEDKGMRMLREANEEIERLKSALAQAAANPTATTPAEVESFKSRLKEEEEVKKQLQEEQDRLSRQLEEREEEMRLAKEQLQVEVEQRTRTQKTANIMSKWVKGLDGIKKKKIQEKEEVIQQKDKELADEKSRRQAIQDQLEQDQLVLEQERARFEDALQAQRGNFEKEQERMRERMATSIRETKSQLQREHEAVVEAYKSTLAADNERLQTEIASMRTETSKRIAELETENARLVSEMKKAASDVGCVREDLDANRVSLQAAKLEIKTLKEEAYSLKEANVRLREENSRMRLQMLQQHPEHERGQPLPTHKDLRALELRIEELMEDKAVRLREITLLKADKKALEMENYEKEIDAERARAEERAAAARLKIVEAELDALQRERQEEENKRRSKGPSKAEEKIIELEAQLELLRRGKNKVEMQLQSVQLEKEKCREQLTRTLQQLELHGMKSAHVASMAVVAGASLYSQSPAVSPTQSPPASPSNRRASLMDLPPVTHTSQPPPEVSQQRQRPAPLEEDAIATGFPALSHIPRKPTPFSFTENQKSLLSILGELDSLASQSRRALLESRLQPPEGEHEVAALVRQDHLQQQMATLLKDMSSRIGEAVNHARSLIEGQQKAAERAIASVNAGVVTSPAADGPVQPIVQIEEAKSALAEMQDKLECANADKHDVLNQLSRIEDENAELLRREQESEETIDKLSSQLEKALAELEEARANPTVVEKVVEVAAPMQYPPDVAELQQQLEDAQADAEFNLEMKNMLEEQLEDLKDFEARFGILQEAFAVLGIEGNAESCMDQAKALQERIEQLNEWADELKEAKKQGIGATREQLEEESTRARLLEQTVQEMASTTRMLEHNIKVLQYELEAERAARAAEQHRTQEQEEGMAALVGQYEADVRESFRQCKERHTQVWRELQSKRRALADLRNRAAKGIVTERDFVDDKVSEWDMERSVLSGSVTILDPPASEALAALRALVAGRKQQLQQPLSQPSTPGEAEDVLLERHQQLIQRRKAVESSIARPVSPDPAIRAAQEAQALLSGATTSETSKAESPPRRTPSAITTPSLSAVTHPAWTEAPPRFALPTHTSKARQTPPGSRSTTPHLTPHLTPASNPLQFRKM